VKFDDDNMARNLMIEKMKIQKKDKRTSVGVFKRNKQKKPKKNILTLGSRSPGGAVPTKKG